MSVIRVHKNKNFTVMSNVHLRDKELSLKAKGLLSVMLSLPDDWSYSIGGLCSICKENEPTIKSALKELKQRRYVIVEKHKPSKENNGRFHYEYLVYETPQPEKKSKSEKQCCEKQGLEKLCLENLGVENHPLYKSTNIQSTNIPNTNKTNPKSSIDKSLEGNINSSFQRNKGKSLSEGDTEYTQEEIHNFLKYKIHEQMEYSEVGFDEYFESCITPIVIYFYDRYNDAFIIQHPVLSNIAYRKIIDAYLNPPKVMENQDIYFETYQKMIDKYFHTDIGQRSGKIVDYHMNHFMGKQVREYMYRRVMEDYDRECDSIYRDKNNGCSF